MTSPMIGSDTTTPAAGGSPADAATPPPLPLPPASVNLRVLRALRRIMRRVEMSSRDLEHEYGVTAPQLICLIAVAESGTTTQAELSQSVHLTASTLVGVLDRLASKGLIRRERDVADRRRVKLSATETGLHLASQAPPPLQDTLLKGLGQLSELELLAMAAALERLVDLLEARGIAQSPMLAPGPIPKTEEIPPA